MNIEKLHDLIPGGAHTYSKGDDQFPSNAPDIIKRGEGAYVYDKSGRKYLDLTMGLTTAILGHAYEPVLERIRKQLGQGVSFQRPSTVELKLAEYLDELFPWLDMFKFAKNGSSCTTAAVKLARAHTGREKIAICQDHPFFSYDDWFIATTEIDRGIPDSVKKLSLTFPYDDLKETERIFQRHNGDIAAVILEPLKYEEPSEDYLHDLKELCHDYGIIFVLDEIVTGFKHDLRGVQNLHDVEPDLTTFGKSIANGFSVDVLAGKEQYMKLGGIKHDQERVFLLSTTNGAEPTGLVAAHETIKQIEKNNVIKYRKKMGNQLIGALKIIYGSRGFLRCRPWNFWITFRNPPWPSERYFYRNYLNRT